MQRLIFALIIVLIIVMSCAQNVQVQEKWHRSNFPNPYTDVEKCGRYRKSSICDPNHILKEGDANQLDDLIDRVANTTKCPCAGYFCEKDNRGYRIVIALVPHLMWDIEVKEGKRPKNVSNELNTQLREAQLFANTVLGDWNPGQCNEGVIIFYSLFDNVLYTMTSTESEKKLTSRLVGEISMTHRSYFSPSSNIFEGLRRMVTDYKVVFDDEYKPMDMEKATPQSPQAVVGAAASFTSFYMLCLSAVLALLIFS